MGAARRRGTGGDLICKRRGGDFGVPVQIHLAWKSARRAMKKLTVDGTQLATLDEGDGVPLLLVHGFPLDHSMWRGQIDVLAKHCRVIAPDLRGFGASGVTEGTVTMEWFADDLARLLDGLAVSEPVVFCGLSMGGYIAWPFWRKHRDRLRAMVLCDTRAAADTPEAAAARLATADRVLAEGATFLAEIMIPKLFAASTLEKRPELIESVRRVIVANDPRGIAAASRGMAARPDMTDELGRIDCPVLVVVGQFDAISSVEEMRRIAEAIPDARLVVIPRAGHLSPLEQPEEFNGAALEFLAEIAPENPQQACPAGE
jgi:pimeloyl-ACP methyl ester carboxylesterase